MIKYHIADISSIVLLMLGIFALLSDNKKPNIALCILLVSISSIIRGIIYNNIERDLKN